MSHLFHRDSFTEDDWQEVQSFDCGRESYQVEVSDWLKGGKEKDSALAAINDPKKPSRVWLYRLEDGTLVGFGALARSEWRWTEKKDPWVPVTLITWCAVQQQFQGQPPKDQGKRYSHQIMDDLIGEALEDRETHPILGLFVQKDNVGAIKLYKTFKFIDGLSSYTDKATGVEYQKMAVVLDRASLLRLREESEKKKKR